MRKILIAIFIKIILLSIFTLTVFADIDGNIDSGGGGMTDGTNVNSWSPGNDGVRITVVDANDGSPISTPIDITNREPPVNLIHFGKVCKTNYNNGFALNPKSSSYYCIQPIRSIPKIVTTNGRNNISEIRSYFTDEQVVRSISSYVDMDFDTLISGNYKLLLEPLAFFKYQGQMFLCTATEAALYDQIVGGHLRSVLGNLTNRNLPLAMFLETDDLGYSAWSGTTSGYVDSSAVVTSLGIGIVKFTDDESGKPSIPENMPSSYDYVYRTDTDVITSVTVSGGQSDPKNPTTVSFNIEGRTYNVSNVYYPEGDSQLVWVKWHTPRTPKNIVINVSVKGPGSPEKATINCKIEDLNQNPPPNPTADDRNDSFTQSSIPTRAERTSASWSVWKPKWHKHMVDNGHYTTRYWQDSNGNWHSKDIWISKWEDEGWWEFDSLNYYADISANMSIKCDSKNPTANGKTMKSGYGINQNVSASYHTNNRSAVTRPQNAVSYFPEFNYENYWRLLDRIGSGFEFKQNKYSTYKNRTHFTPIWFPDGDYTVNTWVIDCWTPDGMLSVNLSDSLYIDGNLWDDWHIGPQKND